MSARRATHHLFFLTSQISSHQELLKWIPPSGPAAETPSTPPNSANSPSPTVASAACSVTSPTRPSASSTPAKSSNSSPRKKSARNSNPSPANSAPPRTSTTSSANSSISSPTAASPPAAPKTSPISLSFSYTAKNISDTKPIWPTKTWAHGKKPSAPPIHRPNPKKNKKLSQKRKPSTSTETGKTQIRANLQFQQTRRTMGVGP